MGYDIKFYGEFRLNKKLTRSLYDFLIAFNKKRHIELTNIDNDKYGYYGEFYVGDEGLGRIGKVHPSTMPNYYCGWVPSDDMLTIKWDGKDGFLEYGKWLMYIIHKILQPNGYILTGKASWQGEEVGDIGHIIVQGNTVNILPINEISYDLPVTMDMRLDYVYLDKLNKKVRKTKREKILEAKVDELTKLLKQAINPNMVDRILGDIEKIFEK